MTGKSMYAVIPEHMTADHISRLAGQAEWQALELLFGKLEHGKKYVVQIEDIPPQDFDGGYVAGVQINVEAY